MSAWWAALRRSVRDVRSGALTDRAAALTYYGLLAVFPGLLVLVSVLGLLGGPTSGLPEVVGSIAPGQVGDFINGAVDQVAASNTRAGLAAVAGVLVAFWSASGYLAAFVRAVNGIEGDASPAKRALPLRLLLTAAVGALLVVCVFFVAFTGGLARRAGEQVGLGPAAVTAWNIAKWPVLVALVAVLLALLYRAGRGERPGRRFIVTPGSLTAVALWIIVSVLFGLYLATFASYQRTYGALSSVIVFLVWLWLTNVVVLVGAEIDIRLEHRDAATGDPSAGPSKERRPGR